jgi:predicted PurR-regulated permease PerM
VTRPVNSPLSDGTRDAADSVSWGVRVAAAWGWRLIIVAAAGYLAVLGIAKLSLVVFALVISLFLTAVLSPLERRLRAVLPGPKSLSALISLLVGIAVLGGIGWFVIWQITSHSTELGGQVTDFVDKTRDWLRTGPLHLKQADLDKLVTSITDAVKTNQGELISGAVQTVRTAAEVAGAALLVLLSTFFMLRDGEVIWHWALSFVPRAAHENVDRASRLGWKTFGGYMRGQVLIAIFHGVTITLILLILRVPLAAALGVLIFLGSFIPLLGLTVTGALCVAVALLEHGVTSAVVVAVAIIVLVQVEGHVLQPVIMSRSVDVHPLAVAVAVFAGTALAGIPGALISVPFVAFVNTTVRALRAGPVPPPTDDTT